MKCSVRLRSSAAALAAFIFLSAFLFNVRADNTMTAAQQVNAINVGWNLGNTLDSYGTWITNVTPSAVETAWGNPVTTREMIAAVRARGFNTIRIPVTWAQFTDDSGNVDPAWMARVHEVVDWALDEDLYVILNVHHDTGEHGSDKVCWVIADTGTFDQVKNRFEGLWTSIAEEFKDYDNRLMFEGYNEMLDMNNSWNAPTAGNSAYDAVNSFAQLFVDTVRATGGNNSTRNLIVNTYVASVDQNVLNNFVLPDDTVEDHLICEVHAYAPYQFCSAEGDPSYTAFDDNCRNVIDSLMTTVAAFSDELGVPVIIGEFGVEDQNNDSDRVSYTEYYVRRAAAEGIRCIWWDNGLTGNTGYQIFDRNALTWNEGIASALIDNAPAVSGSGASDPTDQTGETEASEQTEPADPAEQTEASQAEETAETAVSEQTIDEASSSEGEGSDLQNIDKNQENHTIILIVGAVALAAAYTGLFLLGRKRGRKQ